MNKAQLLAATAIVVGMAGAAEAGTVTSTESQTGTVATKLTDFSNDVFTNINGVSGDSTFQGFNSALGTLTGVEIEFSLNGSEAGTITNLSSSAVNVNFTSSSNGYITAASGAPAALASDTLLSTGLTIASAATNRYSLAAAGQAGSSEALTPTPNLFTNNGSITGTDTFSGALADEFIGTNFTLDLNTSSGYQISGGGNNQTAALTTADGGTFTVIYTYTNTTTPAVPEPASMALLTVGLVGAGMAARKRRDA